MLAELEENQEERERREREEKLASEMKLLDVVTKNPIVVGIILLFFIFAIGAGFSQDDIVEDSISEIWIPKSGDFKKDKEYSESLDKSSSPSNFLAMAIARDGENLLTADRLEEVRARMESLESYEVTYKDTTYTWDDICASNSLGDESTYKFPCARISPMDFFKEADWYWDSTSKATWYNNLLLPVLQPLILRFGVMQTVCVSRVGFPSNQACDHEYLLRTNEAYAIQNGYPAEYASGSFSLLSDAGSLDFANTCRICIETGLEVTLNALEDSIISLFTLLTFVFTQLDQPEMVLKATKILDELDREAVKDFYYYQTLRGIYTSFAPNVVESWGLVASEDIFAICAIPGLVCPPASITLNEASQLLADHADTEFSSVNLAGSLFPLWSSSDGMGSLLGGSHPVGGSGVDMSAPINSVIEYFDATNYAQDTWSPYYQRISFTDPVIQDPLWSSLVDRNPIYAWFMAGETEMTAHCGNDDLPGSMTGNAAVDGGTAMLAIGLTKKWCTEYNVPFETDATYTKQHFARMWYDQMKDSILGVKQGEDSSYSFTLGVSCNDYVLGGERPSYTNASDATILNKASDNLYFFDEGLSLGTVDKNLLMGKTVPALSEQSPLESVGVMQTLYIALSEMSNIVDRVKNCNRPGGPVEISERDAEKILGLFKEGFDETWSKGWDDESDGEVQFVSFFDDGGVGGTTSRFLNDITRDFSKLALVVIILLMAFSALSLISSDTVHSMVLLGITGTSLVIIAFFAGLGFALLCNIKMNIAMAWSLPFIVMGLGMDDMYIVLFGTKSSNDFSDENFYTSLKRIFVPVTMTSLVNFVMFAVMNYSTLEAVTRTAQAAMICVAFLYIAIIFVFPTFCYLDTKRKDMRRRDVFFCAVSYDDERSEITDTRTVGESMLGSVYENVFKPMVIGENRVAGSFIIVTAGIVLGIIGIIGITNNREVGLGLEDFFPEGTQVFKWADIRTKELSTWPINMNWGPIDYADPDTQMRMISQFERVVASDFIAEVDTGKLWISGLALWTTRLCESSVTSIDASQTLCGRDQIYPADGSTCSGTWKPNTYNLKTRSIDSPNSKCTPFQGGICRLTSDMHPLDLLELGAQAQSTDEVCPVFEGWSDEKLAYCVQTWREITGGGGNLVDETDPTPSSCAGEYLNDAEIQVPIPFSQGPTMFAYGLTSHDVTIDMIEETRAICDDDDVTKCFLTGIPYNFWEQYITIYEDLIRTAAIAVAAGFGVSVLFLMFSLSSGKNSSGNTLVASLVGGLLISCMMILSLITTVGLSNLANVNLTGFSYMSYVLSIGFSVEYSVHIVNSWLRANMKYETSVERVESAMSGLFLPMFLAFLSSTIGIVCIAFSEFRFTKVFFFRPLIIMQPVTYFFGCWFLPVLLTFLDSDIFKLGEAAIEEEAEEEVSVPEGEVTEFDDEIELKA